MAWNYNPGDEWNAPSWTDSETGARRDTAPEAYGSPWDNDRTGWSGANADALFEKYARSEAGAVGPQTLAKLREMGVSDDAAIEALWAGATGSANRGWAGGSPTGIMRGIWQHAGVLDKLDNPQLQQAQGQEDQSIWAGQQKKDDGIGPLGFAAGIAGSIFGMPYLGMALNALSGNFNPMSLLSAGIGLSGMEGLDFTGLGSGAGDLDFTGLSSDGGWSLDRLWNGAKDIYNSPATKLATTAAKFIGGGDPQQRSGDGGLAAFNAQLAALIAAANNASLRSQGSANPTFGAGQAVAPDQRAVYLRGSSGQALNPDATVAAMGKPAPAAPQFASPGVSGTPSAPSIPSSQQGAVRLPSRPRMYA